MVVINVTYGEAPQVPERYSVTEPIGEEQARYGPFAPIGLSLNLARSRYSERGLLSS